MRSGFACGVRCTAYFERRTERLRTRSIVLCVAPSYAWSVERRFADIGMSQVGQDRHSNTLAWPAV